MLSVPSYKKVIVGGVEFRESKDLHVANVMGINVFTDSLEMHECLGFYGTQSVNDNCPNFYYLTQRDLQFKDREGRQLQGLQIDHPGEIYMSPDMNNFYYRGIDKFGTLISMIYGIRALRSLEENRLGLHSALLFDKRYNCVHLLVGKNRIGKSTIAQRIEEADSRFILLSDDWNEVDLENNQVTPISVLFSPENIYIDYEVAFNSFGKSFYWKHGIRPYPSLRIGRVIELYGNESELTDGLFLQRSMAHIPLLAQPISSEMFDTYDGDFEDAIHRFCDFQDRYTQGYEQLTGRCKPIKIVNEKGKNSIEDVVEQILLNLN